MIGKLIKVGLLSTAGLVLVGGLVFGRDLCSYASSSGRSIRLAIKDTVPVEFELRRAKDLLDDIIPEMQANVRLIAQQEVEIANLKEDIARADKQLADEMLRVAKLRDHLGSGQTSFTIGQITWTREQLKQDLARRFDWVREAEVVLSGKKKLLENRQQSLAAAVQTLEKTRGHKSLLEGQIAALEARHKLLQATAVGSGTQVDTGKVAQTEQLIAQIRTKLDVAERVLAHESRFVQQVPVDAVDEKELVGQVDEYLAAKK